MTDERKREPRFFSVPAGTEGKPCRVKECEATVYFIPSQRTPGSRVPIDCGVEGGKAPTPTEDGSGVNHYTTCKNPRAFHRPKPPAPAPSSPHDQRELAVDHKPPHCIFCGCSSELACIIVLEEGGFADCHFLQTDPPVCSAPACAERRQELPLRMRAGKVAP